MVVVVGGGLDLCGGFGLGLVVVVVAGAVVGATDSADDFGMVDGGFGGAGRTCSANLNVFNRLIKA